MHIEQVFMISLQNTRDEPAAPMPVISPAFFPEVSESIKTVQILKLACKI